MERFQDGHKHLRTTVFALAVWILLGLAMPLRALEFEWNGAGVTGGTGDTNLSTGSNWIGGIPPGTVDVGSISLNASGGNLTQTGNLVWDGLFFTTRLGTNRGTVTLSQNNAFTNITGRGSNTIVINNGSTSVSSNFVAGDGANPFLLLLNGSTGGSLSIGGSLIVASGSRFLLSPQADNSRRLTMGGTLFVASGGSFEFVPVGNNGSFVVGVLNNAGFVRNVTSSGINTTLSGAVINANTGSITITNNSTSSGGGKARTVFITGGLTNAGSFQLRAVASSDINVRMSVDITGGGLNNSGTLEILNRSTSTSTTSSTNIAQLFVRGATNNIVNTGAIKLETVFTAASGNRAGNTTLSTEGAFTNAGRFEFTNNTSATGHTINASITVGSQFNNSGGLIVSQSGGGNINATLSAAAIVNAATGSISFNNVASGGSRFYLRTTVFTNAGVLLVNNGPLHVTASSWSNEGTVNINGGSIRTGDGAGLLTNAFYLTAGSSIDSHFTNTGTFNLTDDTSITGNFTNAATGWTWLDDWELTTNGLLGVKNAGTILVDTGTLNSINGLNNQLGALLSLAGGALTGGNIVNSGQISGRGGVYVPLNNTTSGVVTASSGTLVLHDAATNSGAFSLEAGGRYTFRSNFANEGDGATTGLLSGSGTYTFAPSGEATFSNTATQAVSLGGNYDTQNLRYVFASGTINVEVTSNDVGPTLTSIPPNGFSLGSLVLPNTLTLLRLTDLINNESGGAAEAIYVENLYLGSLLTAANFDFNGLYIYYNNIIGDGGVNYRGIGINDPNERVTHFGNIIPLNGPPVVPEPSTVILMLLGLPLLALARRRKNAEPSKV